MTAILRLAFVNISLETSWIDTVAKSMRRELCIASNAVIDDVLFGLIGWKIECCVGVCIYVWRETKPTNNDDERMIQSELRSSRISRNPESHSWTLGRAIYSLSILHLCGRERHPLPTLVLLRTLPTPGIAMRLNGTLDQPLYIYITPPSSTRIVRSASVIGRPQLTLFSISLSLIPSLSLSLALPLFRSVAWYISLYRVPWASAQRIGIWMHNDIH